MGDGLFPRVRGRANAACCRRTFLAVAMLVALSGPPDARAADPDPAAVDIDLDSELPPAVQRELAAQFAPTLVFHRDEKYFPASPLFPIDRPDESTAIRRAGADAFRRLGTTNDRRRHYERLSPGEKANLATVYFRAYHASVREQPAIVVEYWLYYVQNDYRVRGNLFPLWVDSSHPNDLEHIHVVLQRGAGDVLAVTEIYSSAHTGTMPPNRFHFEKGQSPGRLRILVERGSHASAPDVNGDGIFTPGQDGSSGYKVLWGIRDRGITWARYRRGYMDARGDGNAVVFDYAGAPDVGDEAEWTYRLVPVEELSTAFDALALTGRERREIFEHRRHPLARMFGRDNGTSKKLLVPPPRSLDRRSIGIERFMSGERGLVVGTQLNLEQQGLFVGARYSHLLGGTFVPDLMVQADAIVTTRQSYLAAQFLMTYPIDGSTTLLAGKALVADALQPGRHQWDWIAAIEFPVGNMRLYLASRSWGPVTQFSKEVRLSYLF
jgi:hypothetical protein